MSIESNLKRIADALEALVAQGKGLAAKEYVEGINKAVADAAPITKPVAPVEVPNTVVIPPAPVVPAPAATAQPVATPVAPAAPVQTSMLALTPEQMNEALVAEFQRVGDRAPIDAAMTALGVTSVNDLPADKQQELLAAVRAIPAPGVA